MIDLKQFCGTDPFRDYLHEPFTLDGFTYATNGAILVRVPKVDGIGPLKKPLNVDAVLKGYKNATLFPCNLTIPHSDGPDVCPACDGRGFEHDCPDCECECMTCNSSGKGHKPISAKVGGIDFDVFYLRQIAALPAVEISHSATNEVVGATPMFFRFDGGIGALMALRRPLAEQIEVEPPAVKDAE